MSPASRKRAATHVMESQGMSERAACRLVGQHRSTQRREHKVADDEPLLIADMHRLAAEFPRYGYRRLHLLWELDGVPQIMPESKLGKGIRYVLNQESRLRTCLSDARIPLDNNDSERDLRHVILGRKNWQIFASPRGGEVACRHSSLMLSRRQNDLNPEAYLADVLMAAETTPSSQVAGLTPWAWAARQGDTTLAE